MVTTERVNRSASLRRVRPNMIHDERREARAAPAATATHCANAGEASGWPSERPTGRPGAEGEPSAARYDEAGAEHLPAAGASLLGLAFRPLFLVERGLGVCQLAGQFERLHRPRLRRRRVRRALRMGSWLRQFTIFDDARKRLEKVAGRAGRRIELAVGALIGAYQEDDIGGLRALLPLAGRTLIEYQVRCAAAAGAAPIVVVVERVPQALQDAFERLRLDGIACVPGQRRPGSGEPVRGRRDRSC